MNGDAAGSESGRSFHPQDPEWSSEIQRLGVDLDAIYEELRRVARGLLSREWNGAADSPTSLVNEAVLRLLTRAEHSGGMDRRSLLAVAVRAMQQVLVDRARARKTQKRGGLWKRIPLDELVEELESQRIDLLDLNEALEKLATRSERQAQMIRMRIFLRMTDREIATHFGLSVSSVEVAIRLARAWLRRELGPDVFPTPPSGFDP
jgi:RNA polymerase sigma factor (TIGR02999 family)